MYSKSVFGCILEVYSIVLKSGIVISTNSIWEIYHHLGMDKFRDVGATIITHFNEPEICKKTIVLLPGQTLPSHMHKVKSEVFTLLWGDVDGLLLGIPVYVPKGKIHSLHSAGGAVIEEVSTAYLPNDSLYMDDAINNNPNRKTAV